MLFYLLILYFFLGLLIIGFMTIVLKIRSMSYELIADYKKKFKKNYKLNPKLLQTKIIGFFHPNCDAGAGGEKVLWQAVSAI
jgi:hypothetical protein